MNGFIFTTAEKKRFLACVLPETAKNGHRAVDLCPPFPAFDFLPFVNKDSPQNFCVLHSIPAPDVFEISPWQRAQKFYFFYEFFISY
jgi:hypothetical protein